MKVWKKLEPSHEATRGGNNEVAVRNTGGMSRRKGQQQWKKESVTLWYLSGKRRVLWTTVSTGWVKVFWWALLEGGLQHQRACIPTPSHSCLSVAGSIKFLNHKHNQPTVFYAWRYEHRGKGRNRNIAFECIVEYGCLFAFWRRYLNLCLSLPTSHFKFNVHWKLDRIFRGYQERHSMMIYPNHV